MCPGKKNYDPKEIFKNVHKDKKKTKNRGFVLNKGAPSKVILDNPQMRTEMMRYLLSTRVGM